MNNLMFFAAVRITAMMRALQDVRNLSPDLVWLRRTPVVPAVDGEIMARFLGRILIADLVADDQKAAVYRVGQFRLESTGIPNLKVGQLLTQEDLKMFEAITAAGVPDDPDNIATDRENSILDNLLTGVRQRMESICAARVYNGFSYDKLGIKMENVSFGTPADLVITVDVPWTDHADARPVTNILTAIEVARIRYGIVYNRMSISLAAFREMIQCVEFQNSARLFLAPNVSFVNLTIQNTEQMVNLAKNVLNLEVIEVLDYRYWSQDEKGSTSSSRFTPINKVALTATSNDNNRGVADFANGEPTEVTVSNLMPSSVIGRLPKGVRGPVGYATVPPDLNPPQITYWGVGRGWSRKKLLQESAVLTVAPATGAGAITDYIPVTDIEL
jgi:hypothetical protein